MFEAEGLCTNGSYSLTTATLVFIACSWMFLESSGKVRATPSGRMCPRSSTSRTVSGRTEHPQIPANRNVTLFPYALRCKSGLNLIARAHQLVMEGYNWTHEARLQPISSQVLDMIACVALGICFCGAVRARIQI